MTSLPTQIIKELGTEYSIDPRLIAAMCMVESEGDTWAVRYEKLWRHFLNPMRWAKLVRVSTATEEICQRMSWGLMQVMGTVARELGLKDDIPMLCRPDIGLLYGVKKLRHCFNRATAENRLGIINAQWAISAYNCGTPKLTISGRLKNQEYVDKVMAAWSKSEV